MPSTGAAPVPPFFDAVIDFQSGTNAAFMQTFASNGGSATWAGGNICLTASNADNSVCLAETMMPIYIKHEEHQVTCFNISFAPPQANLVQYCNMGARLGFVGEVFGVTFNIGSFRQYSRLTITQGSSANGLMSITFAGSTVSLPVLAGMTPWSIMLYIYQSEAVRNANWRVSLECDRIEVYTALLGDYDHSTAIDFGSTGIEGEFTMTFAGAEGDEIFIPSSQFNGVGAAVLNQVDFTKMNVYQFRFSRWSSGAVEFLIMEPHSTDFVTLHRHVLSYGLYVFDTSRPYQPQIVCMKTGPTTDPSTVSIRMGSVSSGIPSMAALKTRFCRDYFETDLMLFAGKETVVGILSNPLIQSGVRNTKVASVTALRVSLKCGTEVKFRVYFGGISYGTFTCERHAPWSCMNTTTGSVRATTVGGIEISSSLILADVPELDCDTDQIWIVPEKVVEAVSLCKQVSVPQDSKDAPPSVLMT
ncbi:hypothetical protein JKP88DRAFT_243872 [Tribonema minus]|uniref:Uncharacterized protein n=1 Tax=Tribonema minus TaxID=303371 RepID=A0A836CJA5_9STRA|nr:hypothetical protein JKP88DRAFT_243872 [Tribonema minus]